MRESASEMVYNELYDDIRQQRLLPSALVQEEELAARFNVSRTPVREAFRRLIQDGLLVRKGATTSVRQLTVEEVANIYPLIAVMEGLAARQAADRITDDELVLLEKLHAQMQEREVQASATKFVELNQAFHDLVIAAARNPSLAREIERFRIVTTSFRHVVLGMPQRPAQSIEEHSRLIAALRDRDGDAAEKEMRAHVGSAEAVLMLLLRTSRLVASSMAPEDVLHRRGADGARPRQGTILNRGK